MRGRRDEGKRSERTEGRLDTETKGNIKRRINRFITHISARYFMLGIFLFYPLCYFIVQNRDSAPAE